MATTPVLDATGLSLPRTADVLDNMIEAVHASSQFGPEEPVGGDTPLGQILAVAAQEIGLTYEAVQAAYDCTDPADAEGVVLDSIATARGMTREAATYSTATVTITGTPATVIPAGSRVRVPDGAIFALDVEYTIPGGGSGDTAVTATTTGPQEAESTAISLIVDAVSGWTSVENAEAALLGSDEETDAALRARMAASASTDGRCTQPSLYAAIVGLDSVDAAVVLTNRTLVTDADGLPGKSFEVIVWPAQSSDEEEDIAAAIWSHLPAGIECHGNTALTVTDTYGNTASVAYSLASEQVIHWQIDVTEDTDPGAPAYPTDGDALVDAAVVAYGATLSVGEDVLPARAAGWIMGGYVGSDGVRVDGVPGIRSLVVKAKIGGAPGGGDTVPITITGTQIATTVTANVTVTSA